MVLPNDVKIFVCEVPVDTKKNKTGTLALVIPKTDYWGFIWVIEGDTPKLSQNIRFLNTLDIRKKNKKLAP